MEERKNPVASRVLRMFNIFVLVTAVKVVEHVFFIVPSNKPDTKNVIGGVVGIVLFFALLKLRGITNRRIGLYVPLQKMRKSFLIAVLVSTISIFAGYMFDLISLKVTDNTIDFGIYAYGYKYGMYETKTYFFVLIIALLVSALIAFEYEAIFRGLITKTGRSVMPFAPVNLIQSLLFAIFYSVYPLIYAMMRTGFTKFMLKALLMYFLHGFIMGIAMGLLRRADGSLWLPIFSAFFINSLSTILQAVPKNTGAMTMFELRRRIAIDVALLVLAFIYYRVRMKKRKEFFEKLKEKRENELKAEEEDEEYEYYDEDEELEKTVKDMNGKLKDASDKFDELN